MNFGEFNKLTKRLLAEGYTSDNHPSYVEVGKCCQDKSNPLINLDGGFQYYRWYVYEKAFRTPCGLMCKGTSCMSQLSVNGQEFSFEEDLACIHCPHNKCDCEIRDPRLPRTGPLKDWCNVHMTEEQYAYEGSVEEILKLWEDQIRREKVSFMLQKNGRVCDFHMTYDKDRGEWKFSYDPATCARLRCTGHYGSWEDFVSICPVLGRQLDKKKGNVYYDVKKTFRRRDLDGTLFEGQIDTVIEKGIRVFEHPVSMDICRNYAKLCQDDIRWKVRSNYHQELFFAERYEGHEFTVEVLNIRAEQKESRDLMQDLRDIKDGITVYHASDELKRDKQRKSEKRKASEAKKIARMEKKILDVGFGNLEPFEQEKIYRYISYERVDELEAQREESLKKKQEEPVQLSLFDMNIK